MKKNRPIYVFPNHSFPSTALDCANLAAIGWVTIFTLCTLMSDIFPRGPASHTHWSMFDKPPGHTYTANGEVAIAKTSATDSSGRVIQGYKVENIALLLPTGGVIFYHQGKQADCYNLT